jgi:hypothetical protein
MLTGEGNFAGLKLETFVNRSTGKSTIELNKETFRTYTETKDMYLESVNGNGDFGLFTFFLRPSGDKCVARELLFVSQPGAKPQTVENFAPCMTNMVRMSASTPKGSVWFAIAFKPGNSRAYSVSVVDRKLTVRELLLPACFIATENPTNECFRQALDQKPTPTPPKVTPTPSPPPPKLPPPPSQRTIGI